MTTRNDQFNLVLSRGSAALPGAAAAAEGKSQRRDLRRLSLGGRWAPALGSSTPSRFTRFTICLLALLVTPLALYAQGLDVKKLAQKVESLETTVTALEASVTALEDARCRDIQAKPGNPSVEERAECGDQLFKRVFVTSTTHSGDLELEGGGATGEEGGDNICNLRAEEAGLSGTYAAWLSHNSLNARDRITQSVVPYKLTNDTYLADDFADLTNCSNPTCLQSSINVTELGNVITDSFFVWSATKSDGTWTANPSNTVTGDNCLEWTSVDGGISFASGAVGDARETGAAWTDKALTTTCAFALQRIYCFQN